MGNKHHVTPEAASPVLSHHFPLMVAQAKSNDGMAQAWFKVLKTRGKEGQGG
jgi:hypothetical protein